MKYYGNNGNKIVKLGELPPIICNECAERFLDHICQTFQQEEHGISAKA